MGSINLSAADRTRITDAIKAAEQGHRGEIVIHVEVRCFDALKRAAKLFQQLGVDKTKEGTGVLLYVASETRKAAVWAGAGIKDGDSLGTWRPVFAALEAHRDDGVEGLCAAIKALGRILTVHAAGSDTHGNELGDGMSS
jgi:uncharacterized membrane protein